MTRQREDLPHGRMRRLPSEFYRGQAFVHWSMAIAERRTGWLTDAFHAQFREIHLHTLGRHELLCPVYCLMPDHLHLLWLGLGEASDQDNAAAFFRRHLNAALKSGGFELQKQPWDVVLREKDRERGAVVKTAFYIAENPVRAGLVAEARAWPYSGAQAAGYPQFDWREADFGEKVWKVYALEAERNRTEEEAGTVTRSAPSEGSGIGNEDRGAESVTIPAGDRCGGRGAESVTIPARDT